MVQRAKTRQVPDISLKQQILEWWAALPEPTTRLVADLCGCGTEYVRVVVRQRKGKGISKIDQRFRQRFYERTGIKYGSSWYRASDANKQRHRQTMARYLTREFGSVEAGNRHFRELAKAKRSKERV